jgi:P-type E1-E2 ATPase
VQVLPGESMPCDGVVLAGTSAVDESLLTGEAMPTVKGPESEVTGGTVNCDGPLVLRATQPGLQGVLSGIASLVETAQVTPPPPLGWGG